MERYSTLWGTELSGPYGRLGSSQRLGSFLMQEIGAASIRDVVELTERFVTGIVMLPGYEKETLANKPLAVVYAPLYLQRYPGMHSGMKCFCALGVSGLEHREVRESSFSHTWFFPREDMLAGGEYNYLDLVMGTPLTTNRDVALHREGSLTLNFDQAPHKVLPALTRKDITYVVATIEALYQKKNVVLILEAGVNFNSRAMQLLTEIYSMMQPVMATETGFATYQSQKRILELSAATNVQIYVVPSGADLSDLPSGKFQILDLANPIQLERTPVAEALNKWVKLGWKSRSRAMMHLFGNNSDYLDAERFVQLTSDFMRQYQDLNDWSNDTGKNKTITSMAQLQAEDKTVTGWNLVPWAKEVFNKRIPELLKDCSVEILNARNVAAFYEYNGSDKDLMERSGGAADAEAVNHAIQQYRYGRKLANVNEAELCRLLWEKADQRLGVGYREKLADQEVQHNRNVAEMRQAHVRELQAKNEEIVAQSQLLAEKETEFRNAWSEQKQSHRQELERQKSAHISELNAAVAAEAAKTASVQAKLDAANQVHADEVARLNLWHQTNMEQQKREAENAMLQMRQQEDTRIRGLEAEKQSLQGELFKSDSVRQNLQRELSSLDNERQNLRNELLNLDNERQNLRNELLNLDNERQSLRNELLNSDSERQNLQDKLRRFDAVRKKLEKDLEQLAADKQVVKADLDRTKKEKLALEATLTEKDKMLKSQKHALDNADKQIDDLKRQYQQSTGQTPKAHVPTVKIGSTKVRKATCSLMTISIVIVLLLGAMIGFAVGRAPKEYEIHLSINGMGDDSVGKMGIVRLEHDTAEAGEMITVDVTPADGWQLEWIKCESGNAIARKSDNEYSFVMPKCEEEIQVHFTEIPDEPERYELHWSVNGQIDDASGEMGVVTLDHSIAEAGETISANVIPADGWKLEGVACESGIEVTQVSDTEYSFIMPDHEECIQVSFVKIEPVYSDDFSGIQWEMVQKDINWINAVVTDTPVMEALLGKDMLDTEGFVIEAILLPENWEAAQGGQMLPYILQLRRAEMATEDGTANVDVRKLLDKEALLLDNSEHILLIPVPTAEISGADWNSAVRAALRIMDLLSATDDRLTCFSYMLKDERIIDLQAMMDEVGMSENWWLNLDRISFLDEDKEAAQSKLGTRREVSLVLLMTDDTGYAVLNYANEQDKAEEMLRIASEKNLKACHMNDHVLIVLN